MKRYGRFEPHRFILYLGHPIMAIRPFHNLAQEHPVMAIQPFHKVYPRVPRHGHSTISQCIPVRNLNINNL